MNKVYLDVTELLCNKTNFKNKVKNLEYYIITYIIEDTQDYDFVNNDKKIFL